MDRLSMDRVPAALQPFVRVLAAAPDHLRSVALLLSNMRTRLDAVEAGQLAMELRRLAPHDHVIRLLTESVVRRSVRLCQYACVNDDGRNEAFDRALRGCVGSESIVLDIGTGSGLLAMMAARAGARHVYAVEHEPLVADAARKNIHSNGLSDRITVIGKDVLDVRVGEDLPVACDVLVQDIIFAEPFSGGLLKVLQYARSRLLTNHAVLLPDEIEIVGALLGQDSQLPPVSANSKCGFDLSAMDMFQPPVVDVSRPFRPERALSDATRIVSFDLGCPSGIDAAKTIASIVPTMSGRAIGLLYWLKLHLHGSTFEDVPARRSSRGLMLAYFSPPLDVTAGREVALRTECIGDRIAVDVVR
ncbi:MAG: 50S ribosomal protein L11 methyltransferase [Hyphomicrobiaceae bacterium]